MHITYADLVRARSAAAVAEATSLRELHHAGLLGSLRETVVRQLISPLLPVNMGVATGIVIGHDGAQSSQIDLIIFDKTLLPPLLLHEAGLVPIEAAIALIEVKSTLDFAGIRQAHEMKAQIGRIPMVPCQFTSDDAPVPHAPLYPTCGVFAFGSDLIELADEHERYERLLAGERAALRHICVAGSGYWFARRSESAASTDPVSSEARAPLDWVRWQQREAYDEILGFLSILLNSLPMISQSRGMPRIGRYLSTD